MENNGECEQIKFNFLNSLSWMRCFLSKFYSGLQKLFWQVQFHFATLWYNLLCHEIISNDVISAFQKINKKTVKKYLVLEASRDNQINWQKGVNIRIFPSSSFSWHRSTSNLRVSRRRLLFDVSDIRRACLHM